MKTKLLSILAISALLFASCSNDDNGIDPNPNPGADDHIKFEIGFAPQMESRVSTSEFFRCYFEDGDAIGIFAVKHAAGSSNPPLKVTGNYIHNIKLIYNKITEKWTSTDGLWYPNDGEVLDFYAYYPYSASVSNPLDFNFNVLTDQSGINYTQSDLLSAKVTNIPKLGTVSLAFTHMLSLVQVKLDKEVNVPLLDGDFKVTLKNVQTQSTFNWTTAKATGAATDITMHKAGNMMYRALVPAQTLAKESKRFTFVQTTVDKEIDFYHKSLAATALAANKVAPYNITMGWGVVPDYKYAVNDPYPYIGKTIGIVFWLDNPIDGRSSSGKIVGLHEGGNVEWTINLDISGATSMSDGKANTAVIQQRIGWMTKFFAFISCHKQGGGWYLPASDELQHLYCAYNGQAPENWDINRGQNFNDANTAAARASFNAKLVAAGGFALQEFSHWSSTEYDKDHAYRLDFKDGVTINSNAKSMKRFVRDISTF